MRAEYVNPFYKATTEVFKMMLDLEITKGQFREQHNLSNGVSVSIGITGDLTGTISYRFPEDMILEMVKIMSGMEFQSIDSFVTSALGEVSNIICGNATSDLYTLNYNCDITTPIISTDQKTLHAENQQVLTIPLKTDIGDMMIDISLRENTKLN